MNKALILIITGLVLLFGGIWGGVVLMRYCAGWLGITAFFAAIALITLGLGFWGWLAGIGDNFNREGMMSIESEEFKELMLKYQLMSAISDVEGVKAYWDVVKFVDAKLEEAFINGNVWLDTNEWEDDGERLQKAAKAYAERKMKEGE